MSLVVGGWGQLLEDFKMLMQVMVDRKRQELEAPTGIENKRSVTAQLASCCVVLSGARA